MKKVIFLIVAFTLSSCGTISDVSSGVKEGVKNLGKNPCYDKETNTIKVGCKKK
jgi:predicted small secreted protein